MICFLLISVGVNRLIGYQSYCDWVKQHSPNIEPGLAKERAHEIRIASF